MHSTHSGLVPRELIFTLGAWFSLVVPILGAVTVFIAAQPPIRGQHGVPLPVFAVMVVAAVIGLAAGIASFWGIRSNGALGIVPAAVLGILANLALGLFAGIFLLLSGLPGP
jgi:hypothetical protein